MKDVLILYPKKTYILIGHNLVELDPIVLKKQYAIFDAILDFSMAQVKIGQFGLDKFVHSLRNLISLLSSVIDVMLPDVDRNQITLPQASYILFHIWTKLVKLLEQSEKNAKNLESSVETAFSKAVDLLCSEYGWHLDYIWENITSDQLLLLLNRISERKEMDIRFYAACHGANLDGKPDSYEQKAMQNAYGKQSKVADEDIYNIPIGNTSALVKLATWVGISIPKELDVERNENSLRVLLKRRVSDLKKLNKLPSIDLTLDPIEVCYKMDAGDIISIKEKMKELGIYESATIDAIRQSPDTFKAMLMAHYISSLGKQDAI